MENCYRVNAKLCKLVEAHPCIYKRSAPDYYTTKDSSYTEIWAQIAREMNETVDACKKRWKHIRAAYARSVNIYKTPTGPNRHKLYYLHNELQFLTNHISPALFNKSNLKPIVLNKKFKESRQSIDLSDDSCTYETIIVDQDSSSPTSSVIQEPIQEEDYVTISKPEPKPEPESEPEYEEPKFDSEENPPQAKKCRGKNMPQQRDPDSDFLTGLLPELKIMNPRQKIVFRAKIFQALEEVFSDPKDFPQKHDTIESQGFVETTIPATRGASARRFFGNRVFNDAKGNLPGEYSQIDELSLVQSDESHTKIKTEIEGVEENY